MSTNSGTYTASEVHLLAFHTCLFPAFTRPAVCCCVFPVPRFPTMRPCIFDRPAFSSLAFSSLAYSAPSVVINASAYRHDRHSVHEKSLNPWELTSFAVGLCSFPVTQGILCSYKSIEKLVFRIRFEVSGVSLTIGRLADSADSTDALVSYVSQW